MENEENFMLDVTVIANGAKKVFVIPKQTYINFLNSPDQFLMLGGWKNFTGDSINRSFIAYTEKNEAASRKLKYQNYSRFVPPKEIDRRINEKFGNDDLAIK